jgi:hypothetical protein
MGRKKIDRDAGKCPKCKEGYPQPRIIRVIEINCYKQQECGKGIKIAVGTGGYGFDPCDFTPSEIAIAEQQGVLLKVKYSKTMETSYLGNTCPHCDALQGNWFLHEHLVESNQGYLKYQDFDMGTEWCPCCEVMPGQPRGAGEEDTGEDEDFPF